MRVVHPLVIDLAAIVGGDVQKRHLVHDGGLADAADDVKLRDFHVRSFDLSLLTHSRRCGPLTRANRKTEAPLAETVGASAPGLCLGRRPDPHEAGEPRRRSEEDTSELQSIMRNSYSA